MAAAGEGDPEQAGVANDKRAVLDESEGTGEVEDVAWEEVDGDMRDEVRASSVEMVSLDSVKVNDGPGVDVERASAGYTVETTHGAEADEMAAEVVADEPAVEDTLNDGSKTVGHIEETACDVEEAVVHVAEIPVDTEEDNQVWADRLKRGELARMPSCHHAETVEERTGGQRNEEQRIGRCEAAELSPKKSDG